MICLLPIHNQLMMLQILLYLNFTTHDETYLRRLLEPLYMELLLSQPSKQSLSTKFVTNKIFKMLFRNLQVEKLAN